MGELREKSLITVPVAGLDEIAKKVYILSLDYSPAFIPGQVVGITTQTDIPVRLYSIASAPDAKQMQILFDLKNQGELTPKMLKLSRGNTVLITKPFGTFTDDESPAWWIATGTGLAPFLSMVRSGLFSRKTLIHGARSAQGFFFQKFLSDRLQNHYIRCCSQCKEEGTYSGRLTAYLKTVNLPGNVQKYYLCGSAEMVVEVRDILIDKGIPYHSIFSEIYF